MTDQLKERLLSGLETMARAIARDEIRKEMSLGKSEEKAAAAIKPKPLGPLCPSKFGSNPDKRRAEEYATDVPPGFHAIRVVVPREVGIDTIQALYKR